MKEVAEETWQGRYGNRRRPGRGTGTGNHGETQAAESESHAGRGPAVGSEEGETLGATRGGDTTRTKETCEGSTAT